MGAHNRAEVIGVTCELRSCNNYAYFQLPVTAPSTWHDELDQLNELVTVGWAFVLHSQLRAYCPHHAERAEVCTCKTHPSRKRLCPVHSNEAAALVWTIPNIPPREVEEFLALTKGI